MNILRFVRNLRFWGGALSDHSGEQMGVPGVSPSTGVVSPDRALQLATVYACVDLMASTISAFPLMVYRQSRGKKTAANDTRLWNLLHDSPNADMTPVDFWRAMIVQLMLRGNAYAVIDRDELTKEAVALYPLSADQMSDQITEDSVQIYVYSKDGKQIVYPAEAVLHLKGIGTGFHGFSKLEFMTDSINESLDIQKFSGILANTASKPSGIVAVKHKLTKEDRAALMAALGEFKYGDKRFMFIEGDMDFKQVAMSPQESQILQTRQFTTEEICRWFGVPPQLIGGGTTASWGNGIDQITQGFEKYVVRPMVVSIEQAISKRVLTQQQRRR
jgi:HK97 family phage portal protein|nr:MAG TPA: portal protein [Caudoviricetes sp.]